MTSQSLRKLQTTLWSMLQKTSRNVHRAWMSDSSPAMVALLSASIFFAGGQTNASDDIAGHAARTVPTSQLLQQTSSGSPHPGSTPTAALRSTPAMQPTVRHAEVATSQAHDVTGAPAAITGPVRKRTWSSADANRTTTVRSNSRVHKMERGNSIEMPPSGRRITRVSAENFEQPMEVLPPVSETLATAPETWTQEYATHVDDVLTGGACRCEQESVGVWWERRLPTIEMVTIEPGQLKQSARNFIDNHTLPPEHDYDVDVYDQKPIAVTSAQNDVPQVPKKTDEDDNDADEPGKNRLKTDIRKIRPTLSYAMRNIQESQLPAGFHEKAGSGRIRGSPGKSCCAAMGAHESVLPSAVLRRPVSGTLRSHVSSGCAANRFSRTFCNAVGRPAISDGTASGSLS
jgi:hypothetical protein